MRIFSKLFRQNCLAPHSYQQININFQQTPMLGCHSMWNFNSMFACNSTFNKPPMLNCHSLFNYNSVFNSGVSCNYNNIFGMQLFSEFNPFFNIQPRNFMFGFMNFRNRFSNYMFSPFFGRTNFEPSFQSTNSYIHKTTKAPKEDTENKLTLNSNTTKYDKEDKDKKLKPDNNERKDEKVNPDNKDAKGNNINPSPNPDLLSKTTQKNKDDSIKKVKTETDDKQSEYEKLDDKIKDAIQLVAKDAMKKYLKKGPLAPNEIPCTRADIYISEVSVQAVFNIKTGAENDYFTKNGDIVRVQDGTKLSVTFEYQNKTYTMSIYSDKISRKSKPKTFVEKLPNTN